MRNSWLFLLLLLFLSKSLGFILLFPLLLSLVLGNKSFGIALTATVSELLPIRCVEAIQRALAETFTGEGLHLLPVVVAGLAEVVSTEAEPPGSLAAVAALVHDVIGSMLFAASHTYLDSILLAEAANEVFGLSLVRLFFDFFAFVFLFSLLLHDSSCTVSHSSIVRKLALVALVVLKLE